MRRRAMGEGAKDSSLCRIQHKPESLPPSYGVLTPGIATPR
jgi:hypothetical protein